jgi:hypothetical protein
MGDDQGLSDSSITSCHCMSMSISFTSTCFAMGVGELVGPLPYLYWGTPCQSILSHCSSLQRCLHTELFHLLRFRVTQVWPGCCSHILQLVGSVLDLWLCNIRWGHQCDWLTLCQGGSFHELLVVTGINDPYGYLPAFSDQGPGYVESFGQMGLQTRSYEAIFHSEGALQSIQ